MVVDGESWDPHALIVHETEWFSGRVLAPGSGLLVSEVIVPLDAVASVTPGEVRLKLDKRATRALPALPQLSVRASPARRSVAVRGGPFRRRRPVSSRESTP